MSGLVLKIGSGLVVLPLALVHLGSDQLASLYIYQSLMAIAPIIDFTFSPNISRAISYFNAGGAKLLPQGMLPVGEGARPNYLALMATAAFQRKVLGVGSACVGLFVFILSCLMVPGVFALDMRVIPVAVAFSVTAAMNIYAFGATALLVGAGRGSHANAFIVVGTAVTFAVSTMLLAWGVGLLGLSFAMLLGSLVTLLLSLRELRLQLMLWRVAANQGVCLSAGDSPVEFGVSFAILWSSIWRSAVVGVGGYLIYQSQVLLSSSALNSEEIASLGLSLQAVGVLTMGSNVFVSVHIQNYIEHRARGERRELLRLFSRDLFIGCGVYLFGGILILVIAPDVLVHIKSRTSLLPGSLLAFILLYRFLEFHHVQYANLVCSENRMPFVLPSILSGLGILIGGYIAGRSWGLVGIIVAPAIVQLLGNNWYPVYLALRSNRWSWRLVIRKGFREIKCIAS